MSDKLKVLITGAAGHLGNLVLKNVLAITEAKVVATTRTPDKLAKFQKYGVDVRIADFNNSSSLPKAFEGATRLLLISTDTIGSRFSQHKNAIDAAVKAGVKHIVYTSTMNPDRSPALVSEEHSDTEKYLVKSGLSYTILRNNFYTDNLLGSLGQVIKTGKLYGAQGGARVSYVTREDCAKAAAGALLYSDFSNSILDITGPRAMNHEELADMLGMISGKEIAAINMPGPEYVFALTQFGLPTPVANLLESFDRSAKQDFMASVSTAVKDLTGQAPMDVLDFLVANKKAFMP
jgi:NAD(P)H dehydrogenase (quinone)